MENVHHEEEIEITTFPENVIDTSDGITTAYKNQFPDIIPQAQFKNCFAISTKIRMCILI